MKFFVYIQQETGHINSISMEALKGAQEIAEHTDGTVTAVTFNLDAGKQLTEYALDEILVIEDPQLMTYNPLYYTKVFEELVLLESPDIFVFGHSYETRDWAPRLSARLDIPFVSDCIGYKINKEISFVRSIYQGKFNSDTVVNDKSFIVSFQAGAFRADETENGSSEIREITLQLKDLPNIIRPGEKFQETEKSVDLSQANIIVSVGRGIGKEENLQMVRDLASAIGGELASSRPVVDAGWLEPYHQVGSSGQTVAPKLYLALGISGAIQHVVGMKGSKNIIVINKDANAPLFEIADYGIVGDIFEILPKLITSIKAN